MADPLAASLVAYVQNPSSGELDTVVDLLAGNEAGSGGAVILAKVQDQIENAFGNRTHAAVLKSLVGRIEGYLEEPFIYDPDSGTMEEQKAHFENLYNNASAFLGLGLGF